MYSYTSIIRDKYLLGTLSSIFLLKIFKVLLWGDVSFVILIAEYPAWYIFTFYWLLILITFNVIMCLLIYLDEIIYLLTCFLFILCVFCLFFLYTVFFRIYYVSFIISFSFYQCVKHALKFFFSFYSYFIRSQHISLKVQKFFYKLHFSPSKIQEI